MRKPSAALVVATAALVVATIGTSVAATGYTITSSKQIKPGSVSLDSLSKGAKKALRGARGPAGPAGRDGYDGDDGFDGDDGEDGEDATNLFAQIRADGSVTASSGGVTARQASNGVYHVNFGQNITQCAATATQASIPDSALRAQHDRDSGARVRGHQQRRHRLRSGLPERQLGPVQTRRANGTLVSTSFVIAIFC